MTEPGVALMVACWALAGLAGLSIAAWQTYLLARIGWYRDGYEWYRVKTVVLFGALGVASARTAALQADYLWFDMRFFGPLDDRWVGDLVIAVAVLAGVCLAAVLFWATQLERKP